MKKKLGIFFLIIFLSIPIFSGDIASFVNLGFSDDSKYFLFGQYGLTETETYPYGELYLVDVKANAFIAGGVKKQVFPVTAFPGHDGSGALYTLIISQNQIIGKYKINPLNTGRTVYILLNGEEAREIINFRDFQTGKSYEITLVQEVFGKDKERRSSFHLKVQITDKSEQVKSFIVGLPDLKRVGVIQYRIRRIIVTPDEKALIFVVERDEVDSKGINVRYMVESLMLP